MQIYELKVWPKLYKLCNEYKRDYITSYDYLDEAFTWTETEEGEEFWSALNAHNIEVAKSLQPHLFEIEEEEQGPDVDSEGFIKWDGGEMPVPKGTMVHVKYRNGVVDSGETAGCFHWTHSEYLSEADYDIVAYKLHTGDGYVDGVKVKNLGNSLKNVYKPLRYTDMVTTPENILKAHNVVLDFDRPAPDLDAMVESSIKGLQGIADGKKGISFSLAMDVDDILNEFKLDLRKKLNLLVVDNIIDGDIVEKFDKLMREM